MTPVKPLGVDQLYNRTDLTQLPFETTDELDKLTNTIGQPRAVEAVEFGMGIDQKGYNIYAMGPAGIGKRALLLEHFKHKAASEMVPPDWIYVYNFENPAKPNAIALPTGKGFQFFKDMDNFVEELKTNLSAALDSDEYRARRQSIEQEAQEQQEKAVEALQEKAQEEGFSLIRTPAGLVFAPIREGEVLSPEEFKELPEDERKQMEQNLENLQEELKGILEQVPRVQRLVRDRLKELNQEMTNFSVGGLINELKNRYSEHPEIVEYLDAVQKDIVENADDVLSSDETPSPDGNIMAALMARAGGGSQISLKRYKVNLFVDNRDLEGAPVITEENPTYQNLIGRVEHTATMGALTTDFSLIRPGALHKANGGYLLLDIRKVLMQPYSWEALKRSLDAGEVVIESIGQYLSIISTVSLEPEPIPLDVKVALYGDRTIYYLLSQYEPDFPELFKVQADFEEQMNRDGDNQIQYARMIATMIKENNLKPFNRGAVARVIEHSSRMVEDKERLTTEVRELANLLREANYWARTRGGDVVSAEDVQKAIDMQIFRADRLRERIFETILRGTFLISTTGEEVGQVNGLSVIQLGGFMFGRPSRITARVSMGKGDVMDIEREVDLSGPIHSKGVLILSGFLRSRYAQEKPLSLSASLVFEQSYGGVDGDSASSAELYALLSAISKVPIKQNFAVTGSINQLGHVQAIGGVNEKIEGFFDICNSRGLTGDQGVLIPESNIKHLMLREDVRQAVEEGKFNIYPINHVDQGIELLTGVPAGEPDTEGHYPPDSINGKVQDHLSELVEKQKELAKELRGEES